MNMGLDKEDLMSMPRVKGKLGVFFLSDMTTTNGRHLETFAYEPAEEMVPQSKFAYPREAPTDYNWDVWKTSGANTLWKTSNYTRP